MQDRTKENGVGPRLPISDALANLQFEHAVRLLGRNPDDPWIGGYVDYEWQRSRHLIETLPDPVCGRRVLEFGCNYGATAIVLGLLGAHVTAIDVDREVVEVARLNARRYGVAAEFLHVPDTTRMPFPSSMFTLVTCISVLEYVPSPLLSTVQREIDRVLAHDGIVLVAGTSNRAWPREVHSGRWGANYIPEFLWKDAQRGVSPWRMRHGFGPHFRNLDREDAGHAFLDARRRMGAPPRTLALLSAMNRLALALGGSAGMLIPNLSLTLRKGREPT